MPLKILLLNYYWPPCGGPAVQRWLDISRFIVEKDIQTFVVTIDEKVATFPSIDLSLMDRIDSSTKVFRTGTSELFSVYKKFIGKGKVPSTGLVDEPHPTFLQKLARFARGNFFLPDPRKGWNKHALKKAIEIITTEKIDIVFTAGPPHSTHLIGLQLKKKFPGIKWIADIHDYWTDTSYLRLFYRTSLANYFDKKLERKVLMNANKVMTHCNSSKQILSKRINDVSDKFFVHTMGFNEVLFQPRPSMPQDVFTISYVGLITENYGVDFFFKAVKKAIDQLPGIPLKLCFVGKISTEIKEIISSLGLEDNFEEKGYLPHKESVEYLYKSSALFLINPKFANEKIHLPGKLYEYLAVFKPIINISPATSETASIIASFNAGKNFEREDSNGVCDYIINLVQEWQNKKQIDLPYTDQVALKYGRKHEAFVLAQRIKEIA